MSTVPPRIVAVDLVRLMAAMLVMYAHLCYVEAFRLPALTTCLGALELCVPRVSPVFFLLAGYFACRNISWKKALYNAWWCLAPFVLWNMVEIAMAAWAEPDFPWNRSIPSLFGMDGTAHSLLALQWQQGSAPLNEPLWFMRDLFFLFLLSPLLFRASRILFPLLLLLSLLPATAEAFGFDAAIGVSPNSIAFFTCGCFLRSLGQERQQAVLSFYSPLFIVVYLAAVACVMMASGGHPELSPPGFARGLLSICFLYQVARWVEMRLPAARRFALKFAPVTFLTFAGHLPIYHYILPESWRGTWALPLLPLACFAFFSLFFFALKRSTPAPLLHLVAHYKQR